MALCTRGSCDRAQVVELNDGHLTGTQRTVGLDEELVIPGLTFATFLLAGCEVTLLTLHNNYGRVRGNLDGTLVLLTFNLREVDLLAFCVDRNLPYTSCGELNLIVGTVGIVEPCIGIAVNVAAGLDGSTQE